MRRIKLIDLLPSTATAPFCPTEVQSTVAVPLDAPLGKRLLRFAGPGLLVAVGYMDPGNWATDIEAGSRFGFDLLFVVVLSSLAAIVLQCLAARLGLATGRDLAQLCRARYPRPVALALWILAEVSIIACDLAEVLGGALAFHLLLGVPIEAGILLTALDTVIVLGLQGRGFRTLEAIVLALVVTIAVCYAIELVLVAPNWSEVAWGLVPSLDKLKDARAIDLAVGIVGATVMPHNLYLHSSIVTTRHVPDNVAGARDAIKLSTIDTGASLFLALLVNGAILVLAAQAFHGSGHAVTEIQDAYELLTPVVGSALGAILFGIALLASGQSSTFTGTIAGQVVMDGFLDLKIPCWQRRLITRALALAPALAGIVWLGHDAVGRLLVASQIVLSLQLPFAIWPMLRFNGDRRVMGPFAAPWTLLVPAWLILAAITAGNAWLIVSLI